MFMMYIVYVVARQGSVLVKGACVGWVVKGGGRKCEEQALYWWGNKFCV